MITQDKSYDEECDAEEDSDTGNKMYKVMYLLGDRRFTGIQAGRKTRDPSHHRLIATADHHALGRAFYRIRREEREILRFERILVRELGRPRLRLGLARQR